MPKYETMAIATYLGRKSSKPKPPNAIDEAYKKLSRGSPTLEGPSTSLPLGHLPRRRARAFRWHPPVSIVPHQEPFPEQGEGDPEAFPHPELRFADAPVVGNRDLGDRDPLPRTPREDVRLDVKPVGCQAEGLQLLGVERPHSAADVRD